MLTTRSFADHGGMKGMRGTLTWHMKSKEEDTLSSMAEQIHKAQG